MQRNLEHLFEIDSAGTGGWHIGSPPDQRAQHAALERNIDLSILRARQVVRSDFEYFDSVIAMDRDNLTVLQGLAPQTLHHKIRLLLKSGDSTTGDEVPDPYYGGEHGFDLVLDLIEDACNRLLAELAPPR